ncbi:PA2169 family four-helix-bundle protein [Rheinheimera salexigens]|uniref:DUF2383 domain-containing protein n=1 Tax=Rheinheimera salexigens TaxID=1628148 RepID=A0A1E7Q5J2_9GAMM|nr:PA2169 family four-helix-bundle protein [Rheinheimera salexigens]OEY69417.1 hypothetical protein BI198_07450 [Rheinheimera salexigens]
MTNVSTTDVKHVSDIVQVLNSGIEFYSDAKEKVDNPQLTQFFDRMINARKTVKQKLQPFAIAEEGKVEQGSAFTVEVRNIYTKIIGSMSSDKEHTYISQLEEVEDKTLEEIRTALHKKQPVDCEAALLSALATMQECHDEMRALKRSS